MRTTMDRMFPATKKPTRNLRHRCKLGLMILEDKSAHKKVYSVVVYRINWAKDVVW